MWGCVWNIAGHTVDIGYLSLESKTCSGYQGSIGVTLWWKLPACFQSWPKIKRWKIFLKLYRACVSSGDQGSVAQGLLNQKMGNWSRRLFIFTVDLEVYWVRQSYMRLWEGNRKFILAGAENLWESAGKYHIVCVLLRGCKKPRYTGKELTGCLRFTCWWTSPKSVSNSCHSPIWNLYSGGTTTGLTLDPS